MKEYVIRESGFTVMVYWDSKREWAVGKLHKIFGCCAVLTGFKTKYLAENYARIFYKQVRECQQNINAMAQRQ